MWVSRQHLFRWNKNVLQQISRIWSHDYFTFSGSVLFSVAHRRVCERPSSSSCCRTQMCVSFRFHFSHRVLLLVAHLHCLKLIRFTIQQTVWWQTTSAVDKIEWKTEENLRNEKICDFSHRRKNQRKKLSKSQKRASLCSQIFLANELYGDGDWAKMIYLRRIYMREPEHDKWHYQMSKHEW